VSALASFGRSARLPLSISVNSAMSFQAPPFKWSRTACRCASSPNPLHVAFISNLMEANVDFEAVDFPQANRLTIHILSAVAEHEAKMISERTRAALAAAKARGVQLGGFRGRAGTASDCAKARQARTAKAATRAADLAPLIRDIRASGAMSLRAIARELNARGITAPRGGHWLAPQVAAVLARVSVALTAPHLRA